MKFRMPNLIGLVVTLVAGGLLTGVLPAQNESTEEPNTLWLRAYMKMREAEAKEEQGNDLVALADYRESYRLFDYISRTHPSWKKNMMDFRRKALLDKIDQVKERLRADGKEDLSPLPGPTIVQDAPGSGAKPLVIKPGSGEMAPQGNRVPPTQNWNVAPAHSGHRGRI